MPIHNIKPLKPIRKSLRNSLSPAEAIFWKNLQRSQVEGMKFRRQHSIGSYVVDFYCPECRLAIEVDGEGHFNSIKAEYDARRTAYLNKLNVQVLRFENRIVFENLQGVLETIRRTLAARRKPGGKGRTYHPLTPS
jgi:very-short-patch-repair endonuclease